MKALYFTFADGRGIPVTPMLLASDLTDERYSTVVKVHSGHFIDENPGTINDGFFVADVIGYPTTWVDLPAAYHNNSGGLSFADGHAEIKRWRDPKVIAQNNSTFTAAGQTPPTDLRWLQSRSTALP